MFFLCHCFFLMTGWTEWHFILFLTWQRLLAWKKQWLVANLRVFLELPQPRLCLKCTIIMKWNKHFIFKWHICWFFFSESLMLFLFPLTKMKTSSWTLQRNSFRRFGNKQNVIWTHDQEHQVSVSTSKQPPQRREGSTVSALLMTSSRPRTNRTHRQTHSIAGKWHYELRVESCQDGTLRFRLRQVNKKKHIHVFTCKFTVVGKLKPESVSNLNPETRSEPCEGPSGRTWHPRNVLISSCGLQTDPRTAVLQCYILHKEADKETDHFQSNKTGSTEEAGRNKR